MKTKCTYKNRFGEAGELLAANYLKEKGYEIVRKNYRYDRAETDIIALDKSKNLLIFVEVKTRRGDKFGEPEESINSAKQASIKKSAQGFILENPDFSECDMRIDVITVRAVEGETQINHIENAF